MQVSVRTPADTQVFDVTVSSEAKVYYVVGRSDSVPGSWSEYFDGSVARHAAIPPGREAAETVRIEDTRKHVAVTAWQIALGAGVGERGTKLTRSNNASVKLGTNGNSQTTITIGHVNEISESVALSLIEARPERGLPDAVPTPEDLTERHAGHAHVGTPEFYHGSGVDKSTKKHQTIFSGPFCTRNRNRFRYSDHWTKASSRILNSSENCHRTAVVHWQGGSGGTWNSCWSAFHIGTGLVSNSVSSTHKVIGHPSGGRICSNSAAWSVDNILTVPYLGNRNFV